MNHHSIIDHTIRPAFDRRLAFFARAWRTSLALVMMALMTSGILGCATQSSASYDVGTAAPGPPRPKRRRSPTHRTDHFSGGRRRSSTRTRTSLERRPQLHLAADGPLEHRARRGCHVRGTQCERLLRRAPPRTSGWVGNGSLRRSSPPASSHRGGGLRTRQRVRVPRGLAAVMGRTTSRLGIGFSYASNGAAGSREQPRHRGARGGARRPSRHHLQMIIPSAHVRAHPRPRRRSAPLTAVSARRKSETPLFAWCPGADRKIQRAIFRRPLPEAE